MIANLLALGLGFAVLSLLAVGGANTLIPIVHAYVTAHGWLDDATFAQIVGLAQIAPGPNFMFIPLVGWIVAGPLGLLVSMVAFIVPPAILAVAAARALIRHGERPAVAALRRALRPVASGVILGAGLVLAYGYARTRLVDILIVVAVTVLVLRSKASVLWWIGAAAAIGALEAAF